MVARAAAKAPQAIATIAVATRFIGLTNSTGVALIPPGGKNGGYTYVYGCTIIFRKGAKELFDLLEKNHTDVEKTMRSVQGLVSYTLVRSEDGGFSVTVCNDKAGTDVSLEKARDWIAKNAAGIDVAAPKVSEGSIVVDLNNGP
jgi:hypothetical protein